MNCPWCYMPRKAVPMDSRPESPKGYICDDCGITWEPDESMTYRVTGRDRYEDWWEWRTLPAGTLWVRSERPEL